MVVAFVSIYIVQKCETKGVKEREHEKMKQWERERRGLNGVFKLCRARGDNLKDDGMKGIRRADSDLRRIDPYTRVPQRGRRQSKNLGSESVVEPDSMSQ
jgi:hypothetical protein